MQGCSSYSHRVLVALAFCVLVTWNIGGVLCCQNDPSLYFIDDHTIKCAAVDSLDQSNPTFQTVVSKLADGTAIDIDVRNRMIYWSDNQAWTINRMNLTSGEVKVIIRDNIGEVYSIAVEWESGLIYWTDLIFERIEVAKLNGSSRRTLITQDVESPMGIAVDPGNGYVVWADHSYMAPKIMRADLTGENHQELYTTFHGLPLYVIIDRSENRVYWTDIHFFYTFIGSIGIDGSAYQALGFLHPVYLPFDLAIFQSNFYWADQNLRGVSWFNFKSSSPTVYTRQNLSPDSVLGVTISDPSTQPMAADQPCAVNNGNCSHLCLLTPGGGRKCACPQGVDLNENGTTCANGSALSTQAPPLPDVHVRLVGSSLASSGRVEVLYNGQWGTICDDYWGIDEAHVICRMLNYSGAELAPRNARFGQGSASMPILLDNVKCRGDESTIAACRHGGWGQSDCDHSEDASVVCWRDSAPPVQVPTLAPGPHPELQVRLYGGDTYYQGGVEIYLNGTWGTICDDSWGIEEANVICRMLNFTEGALSTQCCGFYNGYGVANQIWLDDVHCVGDEESIAKCRHAGFGRHNCRHTEDVGVVCKHTPIATPTQIVRLADGARESEGRVEIFNDNEWGTVCDDHWDIDDADVVCRMLNYSRALRAPGKAFFGRGNGKIWLGSVHCQGDETSLLQCGHQGWNVDTCDHHEDASVICESEVTKFESNSFILACGSGRSLLYHIPLDTDLPEKGLPLALQTNKPLAVAFHGKNQMAYWTEQSGSIIRAHLNGSSKQVITTRLTNPAGIAIDYIGQNLYIADQTGIKVSRLDGSNQMLLINSSEACHGIALDSEAGHIYYTLIGVSPQLRRADMDGRNVVILVNVTSIRRTTLDVALDKVNRRLYFSDESNNLIKYLDLDSYKTHSVLSGNPQRPVGLTLFNGTLYWTGEGAAMFGGAIYRADVNNENITNPIREVVDRLSYPTGLYAHDSTISDSLAFNHSCAQDNGGCSHLCLINPSGYRCVCPGGPCQTTVTSSVSTTSSVNRYEVTSSSTSMYVTVSSSSSISSASASTSSSLTTPYLSMAISSTTSKVYSSLTKLTPTTTSFVNSISATTTTVTDYCSTNDPCENGGSCQMDGPTYTCVCIEYFHGKHCSISYSGGTVVLVITIQGNQLNIPELTYITVKILNNLCESESNRCPIPLTQSTRRKREISQVTFKPEDVIVMDPKPVDGNLQVELAVVKIMADGSSVVISSEKLTQILLDSVNEIGQRVNGTIINITPKFPGPTTQTTPNSEKTTTITQTTPVVATATPGATTQAPGDQGQLASSVGGSNGGVIGGVVVAVLVIIIMVIALAVWYFRVKIPSLPFSYKRKTNVPGSGPRVAAFENPGYDNTPGFATGEDGLYSDLPQPVVLSPYEDLNEFGATSNPIYSEFGMTKLSSQDKRGGSLKRSDVEKKMFGSQPKMSWVDNEGLTSDNGNDGDMGSKASLQSSASIKRAKANQVDITVQGDKQETDKKESAMVPDAGVRQEQENKGQTVLFLEPGEELEKPDTFA